MKLKIAAFLLAMVSLCTAETIDSNVIHMATHGGWNMSVNLGADEGDTITLDVKCDHDVNGECFTKAPKMLEVAGPDKGHPKPVRFTLLKNEFQHQVWGVVSPTTGNQRISASYYWVGDTVHYEILIVAKEKVGLEARYGLKY